MPATTKEWEAYHAGLEEGINKGREVGFTEAKEMYNSGKDFDNYSPEAYDEWVEYKETQKRVLKEMLGNRKIYGIKGNRN